MFIRASVALWALCAVAARELTPPLRVSNGLVRGIVDGAGVHVRYSGIPYASVTTRFQAPGPEPKWDGEFVADKENIHCRQAVSLESNFTIGQEDCLILNVYTPRNVLNATTKKLLPTMVFIHGGSFLRRSSSRLMFGSDYLVPHNVVLVTINYRLGAQGFLCLGIKEAPGNAGFKDQVAALKWVQRNIRKFGGDPDNVTLFGQSAGSASVSLHILSPMSKGLFHKAILLGGSSLSGWAFNYDPILKASLQAEAMGFSSRDPRKLYEFFMSKSDDDLVVARVPRERGTTIVQSNTIHKACAEKHIDGEEPFLTDLPYNILIKGNYTKVPMIVESTTEEGLAFAAFDKYLNNVDFEKALPNDLEFPSNEARRAVAKKMRETYLGDKEISRENLLQLSRFYGEPYNSYGPLQETDLIMRTSDQPVWHLFFGYCGNRNLIKLASVLTQVVFNVTDHLSSLGQILSLINNDNRYWPMRGQKLSLSILGSPLQCVKYPGATHADELFYLFSQPLLPTLLETNMIERMTTIVTNFAKYGDPTPTTSDLLPVKWLPVSSEDQRSLFIDKDGMKFVSLWYRESFLLWKEVYSKYRRQLDKNNM